MRRIPRRFRGAVAIAWLATILALVFSVGLTWGGSYNPTLAILTLTLIAVIWYTYFTYRAVHREDPSYVRFGLDSDFQFGPGPVSLQPWVENPTERRLWVRLHLTVWVDGHLMNSSPTYSGEEEISIEPLDGFRGAVHLSEEDLGAATPSYDPQEGTGGKQYQHEEVRARFKIRWRDDLGEKGVPQPKYYYLSVPTMDALAVIAPSQIERFFGSLEDEH